MAEFPGGDFTKTDAWPRVAHGIPDKSDIIDIQHTIMATHAVAESKRREAWQEMMDEKMDELETIAAKIAEKQGLEFDVSELPSGGKRKERRKKKQTEALKATLELDAGFVEVITTTTRRFSEGNDIITKRSTKFEERLKAWRAYMDENLTEDHQQTLNSLEGHVLEELYLEVCSSIKGVKGKGKQAGSGKGKGKARGDEEDIQGGNDNEATGSRSRKAAKGRVPAAEPVEISSESESSFAEESGDEDEE